jgi:hypothetical protein
MTDQGEIQRKVEARVRWLQNYNEALIAENDKLHASNDELLSENTRLRQALNDREGMEFRKAVELACNDRLTDYKHQVRELEKRLEELNAERGSRPSL